MGKMSHSESTGGKYSGKISGGASLKGNMSAGNVKGSRLNEGGDLKHKGSRKGC